MKTFLKRVAAIGCAVLMTAALAIPSLAASNYTPITGETVKVESYLIMDKNAEVPKGGYTFQVTPGSAVAATTGKMPIKAGNDATGVAYDYLPSGSADIQNGMDTYTSAQTMVNTGTKQATQTSDPVTLTADQKYVRSDVALDFSSVTFKAPGVYRYVVTESGVSGNGQSVDSDTTRNLDIYVIDNGSGLEVSGYVLHNDDSYQPNIGTTVNEPSNGKAKGFVNTYTTYDITLTKTVSGNQGDKDKYFTFAVTIEDANTGTVMPVVITTGDATQNPVSLTADGTGTATGTFHLRHGDSININGIPAGASYSIVETADGYTVATSKTEGSATAVTGTSATVSDTSIDGDTTVAYTNTLAGVIPTGVILTVAPFAGVIAIGGIGVAAVTAKNRKKDEDLDET